MPQLDPTKALFAAQLFWFFVSFLILYISVAYYIVPRIETVLVKRKNQISLDMERAEALHASTQDIIAGYETKIAAAKKDNAQNLELSRVELVKQLEAQKLAHSQKLNLKLQSAEVKLAAQRDAALESIQDVAIELAGVMIEKVSGIKETPKSIATAVKSIH